MTGKCYYLTTLGAWRNHAARFANSHWMALDPAAGEKTSLAQPAKSPHAGEAIGDTMRILVLVEADEGAHLALEDDARFEPLPHPLAQKSISDAAQAALSSHGVAPGATTFDAAEAAARVHPLLRPRVF
ncbi:MAG: hypothetical protein ACRD4M_09665 [Candidatus Acidiferrales bacterium]